MSKLDNTVVTDSEEGVCFCPHCKVEQGEHPMNLLTDRWSDEDEVECDSCEKKFLLDQFSQVTYVTTKIEK